MLSLFLVNGPELSESFRQVALTEIRGLSFLDSTLLQRCPIGKLSVYLAAMADFHCHDHQFSIPDLTDNPIIPHSITPVSTQIAG